MMSNTLFCIPSGSKILILKGLVAVVSSIQMIYLHRRELGDKFRKPGMNNIPLLTQHNDTH